MLKASSITQLFPKTLPGNNNVTMVEHYEVGKMCRVPNFGLELVEEIVIVTEPQLMACIKFRDYGTIWITSHLTEIRYARADYRELRDARIAAEKGKDTSRKQEGSRQDSR
jgi:hypothetical protein